MLVLLELCDLGVTLILVEFIFVTVYSQSADAISIIFVIFQPTLVIVIITVPDINGFTISIIASSSE